ncbi:hypothetical protein GIB67_027360 [Kingdonia uniflora]|uniref:Uncharacterized protein n=1 Tax=Kingdonia uniflora TaxID=39325 RepID=A0A7J7MF03_9MAGN|nr:hypothetical protein GIB67_027360 [Kingdonia uniflora]
MNTLRVIQTSSPLTRHGFLHNRKLQNMRKINLPLSKSNDSGAESQSSPLPEGDPRKQELLAKIAMLQTQKVRLTDYLDERSAYLTQYAEEANAEFDEIGENALKGLDEASARIMEKLETGFQAFEEAAESNRLEIEDDEKKLAAFENQVQKDRNEGLFFKNLGDKPPGERVKAKETMEKLVEITKENAGKNTRKNIYLALIGLLVIAFVDALTSSSDWHKIAVLGLILAALIFQLVHEQSISITEKSENKDEYNVTEKVCRFKLYANYSFFKIGWWRENEGYISKAEKVAAKLRRKNGGMLVKDVTIHFNGHWCTEFVQEYLTFDYIGGKNGTLKNVDGEYLCRLNLLDYVSNTIDQNIGRKFYPVGFVIDLKCLRNGKHVYINSDEDLLDLWVESDEDPKGTVYIFVSTSVAVGPTRCLECTSKVNANMVKKTIKKIRAKKIVSKVNVNVAQTVGNVTQTVGNVYVLQVVDKVTQDEAKKKSRKSPSKQTKKKIQQIPIKPKKKRVRPTELPEEELDHLHVFYISDDDKVQEVEGHAEVPI